MKFVLRYRPEVVADLDTGRRWWAVGAHFRRDVSSLRCVLVRHGGSHRRIAAGAAASQDLRSRSHGALFGY